MMGVFCITGPGGSSLPSWREGSCLNSVSTSVDKWAPKSTDACVGITRRSLGWYSRSLLGPDRFCPSGKISRSPRRRLRLRPCPYIPGWLWPDSDMLLRTWLTDYHCRLMRTQCSLNTQYNNRKQGNFEGRDDSIIFFPWHTRLKYRYKLICCHNTLFSQKLGNKWAFNVFSTVLAHPLC